MPFLDTSDVLLDPDFATAITVERTVTTVGTNGETVTTTTSTPGIVAVVTPATSNDLRRMADAERLGGGIAIHSIFRLHAGGLLPDGVTNATADVVEWQGRRWSVFEVSDWTQFGAGFVRATATMLDVS